MSVVIGLSIRESRIDGAVVRHGLGRPRVLSTFSLDGDEKVGVALRAKLQELGLRSRRVHVGVPRRRAIVKVIELPEVTGADLRRMVGFELERHLPFPAAEAVFDFILLGQAPGRPVRVLLVALERRTYDRIAEALREAGLVPRLVDIAIHSVATMVAETGRGDAHEAHAVAHIEEAGAELAIVRGRRLILSRTFPLPPSGPERTQALATELRRSLDALDADDHDAVADVTVTGAGAVPPSGWTELPIHTELTLPPGPAGIGADSSQLPAIAMALRAPRRGALRTNLMPDETRPRPFPWAVATAAGLAGLTLLLALAIPGVTALRDERRLTALNRAVSRLTPEAREAEQLAKAVERARREAETLRGFEVQHLHVLPVLRELTELLPSDVYLTNFSIDRKGIELTGFAATAAQLIPLLDASPTIDRVEFTSPVTKGRDREQFRLRAVWERPMPAPARPAAPARTR